MSGQIGVLLAVAGLAVFHSLEPGHAWPVAGIYALNQERPWRTGVASGLMLSFGHILAAGLFLGAFTVLSLALPLHEYTSYIRILAGLALFYLAYRLYTHQHDHDYGDGHDGQHNHDDHHAHEHDDHDAHGHDHASHAHGHGHDTHDHDAHAHVDGDRDHGHDHHSHDHGVLGGALSDFQIGNETGLWGVAAFAFLLGLVHEEGYALVGFCAGTFDCLPIIVTYGVCIVVTITSLVVLTVATATRFAERMEGVAGYLPAISAIILGFTGTVFVLEGLGVLSVLP